MFENEIKKILEAVPEKSGHMPYIIAIDGRCASGKTTLAAELSEKLDCNVFHMDDFFLRPCQRTEERLSEAGGNCDRERFYEEVIAPLKTGEGFSYRPFDCKSMSLLDPVSVSPKKYAVIEGSYSCHPILSRDYHLRIFMSVSPDEQMRRIIGRCGSERAEMFRDRWIPMEEKYFTELDVKSGCDICFEYENGELI